MTELTDYIRKTGPANVLAQLRTLPYWRPVLMAVKTPDDLVRVVDALGLRTLDEARAMAASNTGMLMPPHLRTMSFISSAS